MIVPEFWAEAKQSCEIKGRKLTIKRFGWSDVDLASAQSHAQSRVKTAVENITDAKHLLKSEPKVAYNGADGVPIREEIIKRHQDVVITRNSYGALCLNTPDILFGDLDYEESSSRNLSFILFGILLIAIGTGVFTIHLSKAYLFLSLLAFPITNLISHIFRKSDEQKYQENILLIKETISKQPDWRLRVYKTPKGIRLLAMHKTFDPREQEVKDFFTSLKIDKIYQQMCSNQNCFRARVSAKPWRIGIESHLKPRPGVWPINPEKIHLREQWVSTYEEKASAFAACKFIEELGTGVAHSKAREIQMIHDEYCKALSDLPIA